VVSQGHPASQRGTPAARGTPPMARRDNGAGTYTRTRTGLWQGRVRVGGHRLSFYGRTRAEAVQKVKEAVRRHESGMRPDGNRLTVRGYLEQWVSAKTGRGTHLRPTTARRYRQIVQLHLIPMLGDRRLLSLTSTDVERALAAALDEGLSLAMASHCKTVLGTALADAIRDDLVPRNVGQAARAPTYRRPEVQPLTRDQARQLLDSVRDHPLGPIIVTALSTGLRQGELLGLQWSEVALDRGTLTVQHALQDGRLVPTKTERSRRTVGLPPDVVALLRLHRQRQREWRLVMGIGWRGADNPAEGLVFTNTVGRHMDGPAVTHQFQALLAMAGLPRIRFHDLRHTYATLLLNDGVPLHTVSRLLGHSQIAITADTYGHLAADAADEVAARMGALLAWTG